MSCGVIYFAHTSDGLVKIGYTLQPLKTRVHNHRSIGLHLEVFAVIPACLGKLTEAQIHQKFAKYRVAKRMWRRGPPKELFSMPPDIIEEIKRYAAPLKPA